MKKISTCLIALIFSLTIFISQPVKAAGTVANVNINGEVKKGNSIEITVDLENVSNLYGGDIKFFYDKEFLKVESITPNRDIISENYMQYNKPENGDKARFYFTMQGDATGYSGSANFVKIKASVLKDGELKLDSKNLFLQLVEKPKGKDPVNMQFTLKVAGVEVGVDQGENNTPDTPNTPDDGTEDNDDNKGESNSGEDTNKPNEGTENTEGDGNSTNSGNSIGNSIGSSIGNKIGNIISSSTNPNNSNENSSDNKDNSETVKNNDNENKSEDELVEDSSDEKNLLTNKQDSEDKSNNYIVYGGIVLVLVCGVACYIYIRRKKDK